MTQMCLDIGIRVLYGYRCLPAGRQGDWLFVHLKGWR
jgi:hypothetical protein